MRGWPGKAIPTHFRRTPTHPHRVETASRVCTQRGRFEHEKCAETAPKVRRTILSRCSRVGCAECVGGSNEVTPDAPAPDAPRTTRDDPGSHRPEGAARAEGSPATAAPRAGASIPPNAARPHETTPEDKP